jgi:5-methylcytosine-specific restriction enzyme subunit McrC
MTIPIKNLYYLYAYAWDQFHFTKRVDTGEEVGPDAPAFFGLVLVRGCQQVFRRGVDRSYRTFVEERAQLRGRVRPIDTERDHSLQRGRVWCEYDELTHDSLINQIIKSTLRCLKRSTPRSIGLASDLTKVIRIFDALGVADINVKPQDFRRVQLHRNNAFYGFLLHVCELLHTEMFPKQAGRGQPFASLGEDQTRMNLIFERFVRNLFSTRTSGAIGKRGTNCMGRI